MSASPCGVYVRVSDLRNAVTDAPNVSQEMISIILGLMNKSWGDQEIVDVMLMAECLWRWQFEITDQYRDPMRSAEFEVIMQRVKDANIVPTVATFAQSGPIKSEIQEIVEDLRGQKNTKTSKNDSPTH